MEQNNPLEHQQPKESPVVSGSSSGPEEQKEMPDVIKFLLGEGPLDGYWYGEHLRNRGPFWWRTELRKLFTPKQ